MLPRTREEAIAAVRAGARLKFVFFWGHRPNRDGSLGTGCLSQWWPCEFQVEGVVYRSAEHFMMAEKARLFSDEEMHAAILASGSPGEAKALGRQVRGFDQHLWERHRRDIVTRGNTAKFGAGESLRTFLVGTRKRVLVEASPTDRIWGIGLAAPDPAASDPREWLGENLLGFALMDARLALDGDRS